MSVLTRVLLLGLIAGLPLQKPPTVQHNLQSQTPPALRLAQYAPASSCCAGALRCSLDPPQAIGTACTCTGPDGAPVPGSAC